MPSFLQFSSKVKSSPGGVTPPSSFPARLLSPMKSHPVSILLGTQCGDSEVPWKQRHEDPSNRSITSIWALRLRVRLNPDRSSLLLFATSLSKDNTNVFLGKKPSQFDNEHKSPLTGLPVSKPAPSTHLPPPSSTQNTQGALPENVIWCPPTLE